MKLAERISKAVSPALTVIVLICIVYLIKGIYPFGTATIDYYDMSQQMVAFYYHLFDAIHSDKSVFFDWYTALGTNMIQISSVSSLSPLNIFFLFVPREGMFRSLSVFLMLKMALMALFMYIFLDRAFDRAPYADKLILSVNYGMCGFVLMNYTIMQWVDVAVFFPLLMLGLLRLIRDKKRGMYILMLIISMLSGYYLTAMILLFIFLAAGLMLTYKLISLKRGITDDPVMDVRPAIGDIVLSTLSGCGASAFITLPQLIQTFSSSRFESSDGGLLQSYHDILASLTPAYTARWFSLIGISFSLAVILTGMIKSGKDRGVILLTVLMIAGMCAGLLLENINLIWHFGSYVHYPVRNGFIINFVIASAAGFYSDKMNRDLRQAMPKRPYLPVCVFVLVAETALICLAIDIYDKNAGMQVRSIVHTEAAVMLLTFVLYMLLMNLSKGRYSYVMPLIFMAEMCFFAYIFLGKPAFVTGYTEEPEQNGEYITASLKLKEELGLLPDELSRIKNPDGSLNTNYGMILQRPTLANYTHLIPKERQEGAGALGYSIHFTRLLDAGGTVFTDALLSVDNVISCLEQDESLYDKLYDIDLMGREYHYCSCRYRLPFGIVTGEDLTGDDPYGSDLVEIQNRIYKAATGDSEGIASYYDGRIKPDGKALYLSSNARDKEYKNVTIKVNGEEIRIPSIKEEDNTGYPAHFNNNAVFLGTFEGAVPDIEIREERAKLTEQDAEDGYEFSYILSTVDLDKLRELCDEAADRDIRAVAKGRKCSLSLSAREGEYLLIPLAYDKGWRAYVNGTRRDPGDFIGLFMQIGLEDGNNDIELVFCPPGMRMGLIISVISVILLILYMYKGEKIRGREIRAIGYIYETVWISAVLLMYIIPVAYGMYALLRRFI